MSCSACRGKLDVVALPMGYSLLSSCTVVYYTTFFFPPRFGGRKKRSRTTRVFPGSLDTAAAVTDNKTCIVIRLALLPFFSYDNAYSHDRPVPSFKYRHCDEEDEQRRTGRVRESADGASRSPPA